MRLQPLTRARIASLGELGRAWVEALPALLAEVQTRWGLELGRELPGGSSSYVVTAQQHGRPVVLKLALVAEGLDAQVATLQRADGRGYARLLEADLGRGALLLEALGASLEVARVPVEDKLRTLVDTLQRAWMPPAERPAPTDKAGSLAVLIGSLWETLQRPCPGPVVDEALRYAALLADVPTAELRVLHGDPHPANALLVDPPRTGAESGYCFVDPDGFVSDRAYDLGVVLRDWSTTILAAERSSAGGGRRIASHYCDVLGRASGVPAERIWRWGFLERVSTGLYVMSFGATTLGQRFLDAAGCLLDPSRTGTVPGPTSH